MYMISCLQHILQVVHTAKEDMVHCREGLENAQSRAMDQIIVTNV